LILDLKVSTSIALWALFLQFSYLLYTQRTLLLGFENSLLHANKQQKTAKHWKQGWWKLQGGL